MKEKSVKMVTVMEHVEKWEKGILWLPSYQSGKRWSDSQAISYCKALLAGLPVPNMYIGDDNSLQEGQQRTNAKADALAGKLGFTNEQIEALKACKVRIVTLTDYTDAEIRAWYIAINNNGTAHNKLEIAKAKLSNDDAQGFTMLETHSLWEKLPIKSDREGIKAILMQSLALIESETCAVDIGSSAQQKLMESIGDNFKAHTQPITALVDAVDYLGIALPHKQKWLKRGMIGFILALAVEAIEQGDKPSLFGGFLQSFFNGKITIMQGKKNNIPRISSEVWSEKTSGAGTSKPLAVKERWDIIFTAYSNYVTTDNAREYTIPEYILKAQEQAEKLKDKEKDRELYNEFKLWKEAQKAEK